MIQKGDLVEFMADGVREIGVVVFVDGFALRVRATNGNVHGLHRWRVRRLARAA